MILRRKYISGFNMDNGKVNIHGKQYETVASRVQKFRTKYKRDYSIETELVERDDNTVVMKATIRRLAADNPVIATGYAEEKRDSSMINRTSALENAETSAIGRCLAAFGLAGTEYASADEVANAIQQQNAPLTIKPFSTGTEFDEELPPKWITVGQAQLLLAKASLKWGIKDKVELLDEFIAVYGKPVNEVTTDKYDGILAELKKVMA